MLKATIKTKAIQNKSMVGLPISRGLHKSDACSDPSATYVEQNKPSGSIVKPQVTFTSTCRGTPQKMSPWLQNTQFRGPEDAEQVHFTPQSLSRSPNSITQ